MTIHKLLCTRRRVVFRRPKRFIGQCDAIPGGKIFVALKPRRLTPAQVYLHELIHHQYPDWKEYRVLAMERHLWKRITLPELYKLYRKLFRHPYTSKEG